MKKNLVKKAVLPALVALLCSVVALTSVSYAWFTMGNTGSVNEIDVKVGAADGMQLSVDASSWKSEITVDELKGITTNQMLEGVEIMPVSTDGSVTNGALSFFEGQLTSKGDAVLGLSTTSHYMMFDLYVKVDNKYPLQLASGSTVTGVSAKPVHYATRVAFVDLGCDETNDPDTSKGLDGDGVESSFIWEPNADIHTDAAQNQYKVSANQKIASYNAISGITGESPVANGFYATTTKSISSNLQTSVNGFDGAKDILQLEAGTNKVRVYIWVEGQDVDCLNDVSGTTFKTKLDFSIPKVSE